LLPEGVFIEATVADFCDRGQACVCAAGGGVLLLRLATGLPVKWQQLSGRLLGIEYPDPEPRVEHCWMLQPGAEVLIASDGLFDQEVGPQRLGDTIRESLEQSPGWHCVHGHVVQLLDRTLATNEQFDDVTVVTICNHTNA
jgi:serine phosphatase RsbU (regulator of sigma subunit)